MRSPASGRHMCRGSRDAGSRRSWCHGAMRMLEPREISHGQPSDRHDTTREHAITSAPGWATPCQANAVRDLPQWVTSSMIVTGRCRLRSHAHRQIQSCVFHFRDDSTELLVDDLLNSLELLGGVVAPIRLRDGNERRRIEGAFKWMVMILKLAEPSIRPDQLHRTVDMLHSLFPGGSKYLSQALLERLPTP